MERVTHYLDLSTTDTQHDAEAQVAVQLLRDSLHRRNKIVIITGAGVSVSAGIPDFRSPQGLFQILRTEHKRSGKDLFDASQVYSNDDDTASFHELIKKLSELVKDAKPTAFHHLMASLAAEGRLLRLYTQNIDHIDAQLLPLHTEIPLPETSPWPLVVQLHGSIKYMLCQKCQHVVPLQPELFNGPTPPPCPKCISVENIRTMEAGKRSHGIGRLRPRIVLYNEDNPDGDAIGAILGSDIREKPDAIVVVGTSMKIKDVQGIVHNFCHAARKQEFGTAIWINKEPISRKDLEDCFDLVIKGDSDQVAKIVNLRRWDEIPTVTSSHPPESIDMEEHDSVGKEEHDSLNQERHDSPDKEEGSVHTEERDTDNEEEHESVSEEIHQSSEEEEQESGKEEEYNTNKEEELLAHLHISTRSRSVTRRQPHYLPPWY